MRLRMVFVVFLIFIIGCKPNVVMEDIDYSADSRPSEDLHKECEDLGGKFNECASACGPEAEACIAVCVPKCEFGK